jgi:hypothetical protein
MFCSRCGKADQKQETYCRQCGLFLPDLSKSLKRESPPEEHLKANTVLSVMTITASFTLSFLLFLILGFRSFTHPLIYATAGILLAIGGWHIQTLIRTLMLKKQWKRRVPLSEIQAAHPRHRWQSNLPQPQRCWTRQISQTRFQQVLLNIPPDIWPKHSDQVAIIQTETSLKKRRECHNWSYAYD